MLPRIEMSANTSALMAPSFALSFFFFFPYHKCAQRDSWSSGSDLFLFHLVYQWPTHAVVSPRALFLRLRSKWLGGAHVGSALRGGERPRLMCNKSEQVSLIRWDPDSPGREPQQRSGFVGGESRGKSSRREKTPDGGVVEAYSDQCHGPPVGAMGR